MISEYKIVMAGTLCDRIISKEECDFAAQSLGLSVRHNNGQIRVHSSSYRPPYCWYHAGSEALYYNPDSTSTKDCGDLTDWWCLCRQNDFCAKFPCRNGQGDCDDDTECEGSLVCGHMNCANSTISDCCTQPCNNDSDCVISRECDTGNNQCYLWPDCNQNSPCAEGEGDCDHHLDCEGALLCVNDNCARGLPGMDCCTANWTEYILVDYDYDSGTCDKFITSEEECEFAAEQLGLDDITATRIQNEQYDLPSYNPPYCFYQGSTRYYPPLKYNNGTHTGPCTKYDKCLCIENNFCAKTPCGLGQGDCDDDSECEGSLVCGHFNCMNDTMRDCCTGTGMQFF